MPYTPEQARKEAERLGPVLGLREDQLPTGTFHEVLNGLEECERVLQSMAREGGSPAPLVQLAPPSPEADR
jgi:hypothetical protein